MAAAEQPEDEEVRQDDHQRTTACDASQVPETAEAAGTALSRWRAPRRSSARPAR